MPKGIPKHKEVKKAEVEKVAPVVEAPKVLEVPKVQPPKEPGQTVKFNLDPWAVAIAESRKLLDVPLAAGQAYYESPEGFIMIDDAERGRAWCRQANKGTGMWINPRR